MNGIILAILSFIFTPLYSNLVGIENYGLINVWMISLVIATVFDFGINLTINNIISNNQINQIGSSDRGRWADVARCRHYGSQP